MSTVQRNTSCDSLWSEYGICRSYWHGQTSRTLASAISLVLGSLVCMINSPTKGKEGDQMLARMENLTIPSP